MFKFIFLILLLIAFVAPLRRFLFWLVVGRQITNLQKKYQEQQPQQNVQQEGEIKVNYNPKNSSKSDKTGGQYVDYEEVE